MKKIIYAVCIIVISIFVLTSCSERAADPAIPAEQTPVAPEKGQESEAVQPAETELEIEEEIKAAEIIQISPEEAYQMIMEDEDVFLLDVRTQEEYEEGYIEGATLIPVSDLAGRLDEVPKDKKIVIYCRTGNRSMTAANILISNGYEEVYNVQGGIIAWDSAGLPVIAQNG
jgi:rhodanese-related sulfurtransferase